MTFENVYYNDMGTITATIQGKERTVPIDPANRHYAEIMRQVADEGLVIAEPV